jgi:predicted KAP-like P-loop ATPase
VILIGEVGLRDIPVLDKDNDLLGMSHYAKALTDFITRCQTPMTIALQGDWGSGKSSLLTGLSFLLTIWIVCNP